MRKIIFVICFLSVSNVFGDIRVLDFLYQVRSNNSEASLRFEEINQNARNLELERALSEIENITNSPLEISSLSGLNRAKANCNIAIMKIASGDYIDGLIELEKSLEAFNDLIKPFDPAIVRALVVKGIASPRLMNTRTQETLYVGHKYSP